MRRGHHPIGIREVSPLRGARSKPEVNERGAESSCVGHARLDEHVEVQRRARPAVDRECMGANQ